MRLYKTEKLITTKSVMVALGVFIAIFVFCAAALQTLSGNIEENETETLKNAIDNAVVNCYSIEGRYPESLDYIVENYGVVIDNEKYIVRYNIFASNIKPQVTVIEVSK